MRSYAGLSCSLALLLISILSAKIMAQSSSPTVPPEWLTHTERTDYRETPRYDETVAFSQRLAAASNLIRYATFGRSGEGRELPLLIAASISRPTLPVAQEKPLCLFKPAFTRASPMGKMLALRCCGT